MSTWLSELNAEQKLAATTTEGHIRVLAGPGTGSVSTAFVQEIKPAPNAIAKAKVFTVTLFMFFFMFFSF